MVSVFQRSRHWALVGSLYLVSQVDFALAAPADESELMDLSIEELLTVRSTVAGKVPERNVQVPGSVSVATAETMERYGLYTVADLADITPGYASYSIFGERVLSTRGQKAGSFNNNKHLLLLDGIPINHARGYKASTEYELPLFMAEQVEFLSGPSSAFYGTSAFLGVVSVVPKQLELPGTLVETRAGVGPLNFERRVFTNILHRNASTKTGINFGYYSRQPSRDYVGRDESELHRNWDDQDSLFLRIAHDSISGPTEGLGAGLIYLDKTGGLGEFWSGDFSSELNQLRWTTFVPYLRYRHVLDDHLTINSYLKYNLSREAGNAVPYSRDDFESYDGTGAVFSTYDLFVHDIEALVELHVTPNKAVELITGYNIDSRVQADPTDQGHSRVLEASQVPPLSEDTALVSPRVTTLSTYAQARIRLPVLEELSLIAGGRLDGSLTSEEQFLRMSPRVGIVQQFSDSFAVKALYSTALRAPGIKEYGLNAEARATLRSEGGNADGIEELTAETIQSFELAGVYSTSKLNVETSLFTSTTDSALNGVRYQQQNIFANDSESERALGLTATVSLRPLPSLDLMSNYSYSVPFEGSAADEVPDHDLHAAASYLAGWAHNLRATLWSRWVGAYYKPGDAKQRSAGFTRLNANLLAPLTTSTQLELLARNLLGAKDYYPFNGNPQVSLPERSVLLSFQFRSD